MKLRCNWVNDNYGEESVEFEHRPTDDPASVTRVSLERNAQDYTLDGLEEFAEIDFRVGIVYQGTEYWSDWTSAIVDPALAVLSATSFDGLDLEAQSFAEIISAVESAGAEVVVTPDSNRVAESTTRSSTITDYGQHKQAPVTERPQNMWILVHDNNSGRDMRIFMQRATAAASATEAINTPGDWDFNVLMEDPNFDTEVHTGTVNWELSDATVAFANSKLSSDDGAWAVKDATTVQGNGGAPSAPYWGIGNWNSGDTSAQTMFGTQTTDNFKAVVIMASGPDSIQAPTGLAAVYEE